MTITDTAKCCGCAACADACPKGCITMTYDRHGFYTPSVDASQCINCQKCVSLCPVNHPVPKSEILSVCKGHAADIASEANQKSTSGAIFGILAEQVIAQGGLVAGVAFNDDYTNISHILCENMEQVSRTRGSKYIQSQTQGIYKAVRAALKTGRTVLFSGTPCQVAGLRAFLKEVPENLITVDFVCHGVASTKFYQEYLKTVAGGEKVSYVGFRDKDGHYLRSTFRVVAQQRVEENWAEKNFGKAFANNLVSRTSCGTCQYATAQRVADISLADNYMYADETEAKLGSSLVFVNTVKGRALLDAAGSNAVLTELEKGEVLPRIMHFNHPAAPHADRDKLLSALEKGGYTAAAGYISTYTQKQSLLQKGKALAARLLGR